MVQVEQLGKWIRTLGIKIGDPVPHPLHNYLQPDPCYEF